MIRILRASIQKDGWKLRFGHTDQDGGLIVSVFVRDKSFAEALNAGLKIAREQIKVMEEFNRKLYEKEIQTSRQLH